MSIDQDRFAEVRPMILEPCEIMTRDKFPNSISVLCPRIVGLLSLCLSNR